jgi:hypothetical protein
MHQEETVFYQKPWDEGRKKRQKFKHCNPLDLLLITIKKESGYISALLNIIST